MRRDSIFQAGSHTLMLIGILFLVLNLIVEPKPGMYGVIGSVIFSTGIFLEYLRVKLKK